VKHSVYHRCVVLGQIDDDPSSGEFVGAEMHFAARTYLHGRRPRPPEGGEIFVHRLLVDARPRIGHAALTLASSLRLPEFV
jgi:hypothetical protein